MSGRGNGSTVKGNAMSHSNSAGLQFSVRRIHWLLRGGHCVERLRVGASVYLASFPDIYN